MSLNIEDKKAIVESVKENIKNAESMVLAENGGIDVVSMTELRAKAREQGVYLRVIRNTIAVRAVEGTQFEALRDQMKGPLLYAVSEDPVAAPKVLNDFAKNNPKLEIKGGFYNTVLDKDAVVALASIPSRDELLAKLLGVMQAPVSGFARALAALAEKKQSEA